MKKNLIEEKEKITLSKELQIEMMKFFLKTSIPRKKKQKINCLSKSSSQNDRSN